MSCGSISYDSDKMFIFDISAAVQGRITRIDANIARIFFVRLDVTGDYIPEPVPGYLSLHDLINQTIVPVYHDELLITRTGNYELRLDGVIMLSIDASRQQHCTHIICEA